jgi:REP element-mobilizing transposase RayT
MPCPAVIARLLLKEGKAKVVRRTPFTIKLFAMPERNYTQPLTLGVDTGSSVIDSAVADEEGHIWYLSWKERTFWSDGYFCCSIENVSQETIRPYIESQE